MAVRKEETRFELTAHDKTAAAFRSMEQRLMRVGKAVAAVGIAAGAAAAAGLFKMTQAGLASADATAKMASKLGITTKEMRALELTAELTGTSVQAMSDSMQKLTVAVGQMQRTGQGESALKELGLSLDEIARMQPVERMSAISDALAGVGSQTRRAAIGAELFRDRTGQLTNMLAAGAGALKDNIRFVEEYNLALGRGDSKKIEEINDQFTRLNKILQAMSERVALTMGPAIIGVTDELIKAGKEGRNMSVALANVVDVVVAGFVVAERAVMHLNRTVIIGQRAFTSFYRIAAKAFNWDNIADGALEVIKELDAEIRQIEKRLDGSTAVEDWFSNVLDRYYAITDIISKGGEDATRNSLVALSEMEAGARNIMGSLESTMTNAFITGELSAKAMAESIISEIMRIAIRATVLRPIFAGLGGILPGGLGEAFTSAAAVPGRAIGGAVQAGSTKLIGEAGPELVTFGSDAFITPNHAMASGPATVNNFDMRGASVEAVNQLRAMLVAMDSSMDNRIITVAQNGFNRSPKFGIR